MVKIAPLAGLKGTRGEAWPIWRHDSGELAGGRYHVSALGNERRASFRHDRDRGHFQERLSRLPERFRVRVFCNGAQESEPHTRIIAVRSPFAGPRAGN